MIKQINQVKEFHEAFKLTELQNYKKNPDSAELRANLAYEELEEYCEAVIDKDDIQIADALGDQLYILLGTIISHGLEDKIESIFDEIHKSNMSKLDENGQPLYREDGKVKKSNLFKEPNLKAILFPEAQEQGKENV